MKREFEYDFLKDFDISQIETERRPGRWTEVLAEWERTNSKTLRFRLKSIEEKANCRSSINAYIKKRHLDWTIYPEKGKNNIYVVRT